MSKTTCIAPDTACGPELIAEVEAALEAGGLVLLPTETVYGIAARADSTSALAALSAAKQRPDGEPFTWHAGGTDCLSALGAESQMIHRLADRYWPGPLTLVLPDSHNYLPGIASEGRVGVRLTAHKGTASILSALPFPVAMTSANLHGEAPACSVEDLNGKVRDALSLIVTDGPARIGESSTVLRTGRTKDEDSWSLEVLREGLHDLESLRSAAGLRIVFVCTGNTCRSPLAEGLTKVLLSDELGCPPDSLHDLGFHISSAGIYAYGGGPISHHSYEELKQRGIELGDHRATTANERLLSSADKIYCLSHSHLDGVLGLLPRDRSHIASLLDTGGVDVPDPIGGSSSDYKRCAEHISELLRARLREWV